MMKALLAISWCNFALLAFFLALQLLFQDKWWWLGFLNFLTPYWFLPLSILAPAAFLSRRSRLQIAALVATAVFLLLFGRYFLPKWTINQPSTQTLTVMTYNLLGTNHNWTSIRETILDSKADVVALQELNREIAAVIETELAELYPYQILDSQDSLISRYPITLTNTTMPGNWGTPPQVYELDFIGRPIILINAHFYASVLNFDRPFMTWVFREREAQAQIIADFAVRTDSPLIVTSDFNATERSTAYHIMTDELVDSWQEKGWGWGHTFPGGPSPGVRRPIIAGYTFPKWLVRIDYIFHSTDWTATQARLGRWDGVSDHRPVIATLSLGK
jgi:endonuclease/exonuclease/phosphatase (EEP) superfamily protein YafD